MANPVTVLAGFLRFNISKDVENDANLATVGQAFVQVERVGEAGGSIEFPISAAVAALLTDSAACTITVTQ